MRPIQWSLIEWFWKKNDYITESPIIRRQRIIGFFNDSKWCHKVTLQLGRHFDEILLMIGVFNWLEFLNLIVLFD